MQKFGFLTNGFTQDAQSCRFHLQCVFPSCNLLVMVYESVKSRTFFINHRHGISAFRRFEYRGKYLAADIKNF
jgi:hypothetical protein